MSHYESACVFVFPQIAIVFPNFLCYDKEKQSVELVKCQTYASFFFTAIFWKTPARDTPPRVRTSAHSMRTHEFGSDIRSVYRDIHQLNAPATGLEVLYDGRTKGYWLKTRLFSQSELQLIIDGIQSSKFITQAKARDLTQRIQNLLTRTRAPC